MKGRLPAGVLVVCLSVVSVVPWAQAQASGLTIETRDNMRIIGKMASGDLNIFLNIGVKIRLRVSHILALSGPNPVSIMLKGGTILRGRFADKALAVKTTFGRINVPILSIKSIIIGQPNFPPISDSAENNASTTAPLSPTAKPNPGQ